MMSLRSTASILLVMTMSIGVQPITGCTFKDFMTCNHPMTSLSESDLGNLNIVCEKATEASECFQNIDLDLCPGMLKSRVENIQSKLEENLAMCSSPGGNSMCTANDILECVQSIENMSEEEQMDFARSCPIMEEAIDCLTMEMESCPDFLQTQFESEREQLEVVLALCHNNGSGEMCSAMEIMDCMRPFIDMEDEDKMDIVKMCPALIQGIQCMEDEVETCPDAMRDMLESQMHELEMAKAVCGGGSNNNDICTAEDIQKCYLPLNPSSSSNPVDAETMCMNLKEVIECLEDALDECQEAMHGQLEIQIQQLEQSIAPCEPFFGNSSGSGDGSPCSPNHLSHCLMISIGAMRTANVSQACAMARESMTCLKSRMNSCTGFLKTEYDIAVREMAGDMALCKFHFSNPDRETCSIQRIWSCTLKAREFMTDGIRNDEKLCSLYLPAAECELKEWATCPENFRVQNADMLREIKRDQEDCRLLLNVTPGPEIPNPQITHDPNPPTTIPTKGQPDNGMGGGDIGGGNIGDGDIGGGNIGGGDIGGGNIGGGDIGGGNIGSGDIDGGNIGGGDIGGGDMSGNVMGGCSTFAVMGCMSPTQKLSSSDRQNLNVMCPTTYAAVKCMHENLMSCPEEVRTQFKVPLSQMEMGKSLCDKHWSSKGTNVHGNYLLTLVAAMMVLLRHFM